ncbi:hypothetical protein [Paenibacillus sp.]|uniref:hypothetical protein n=1 Tax=Paenibacillus sp. TaxID=58172 RepID=UPI002D76C1D7|nr:hypothetical protein [Paenibacillus sp.]
MQAMGDAFCRFSAEELHLTGIAVGRADSEELVHPFFPASVVEICFAKVYSGFAGRQSSSSVLLRLSFT